jgi:hypothetical protein
MGFSPLVSFFAFSSHFAALASNVDADRSPSTNGSCDPCLKQVDLKHLAVPNAIAVRNRKTAAGYSVCARGARCGRVLEMQGRAQQTILAQLYMYSLGCVGQEGGVVREFGWIRLRIGYRALL